MVDNLEGQTVEIDGKQYVLKPAPPSDSSPSLSSSPVEGEHTVAEPNLTTSDSNPCPPHPLLISRTAVTHAETGDLQNTFTLSSKSEWSLSSKSLVTVPTIGNLQFHSLGHEQIHLNPNNKPKFVLRQCTDETSWLFGGFGRSQKMEKNR